MLIYTVFLHTSNKSTKLSSTHVKINYFVKLLFQINVVKIIRIFQYKRFQTLITNNWWLLFESFHLAVNICYWFDTVKKKEFWHYLFKYLTKNSTSGQRVIPYILGNMHAVLAYNWNSSFIIIGTLNFH